MGPLKRTYPSNLCPNYFLNLIKEWMMPKTMQG